MVAFLWMYRQFRRRRKCGSIPTKAVDLDKVMLDGVSARSMTRDALEARLRQLRIPGITIGAGRDAMIEALARYREKLNEGHSGPNAA
jgi:hypothetical protein